MGRVSNSLASLSLLESRWSKIVQNNIIKQVASFKNSLELICKSSNIILEDWDFDFYYSADHARGYDHLYIVRYNYSHCGFTILFSTIKMWWKVFKEMHSIICINIRCKSNFNVWEMLITKYIILSAVEILLGFMNRKILSLSIQNE